MLYLVTRKQRIVKFDGEFKLSDLRGFLQNEFPICQIVNPNFMDMDVKELDTYLWEQFMWKIFDNEHDLKVWYVKHSFNELESDTREVIERLEGKLEQIEKEMLDSVNNISEYEDLHKKYLSKMKSLSEKIYLLTREQDRIDFEGENKFYELRDYLDKRLDLSQSDYAKIGHMSLEKLDSYLWDKLSWKVFNNIYDVKKWCAENLKY